MKIEKLVENRIEKHLDLVEQISTEPSEMVNTTEETLPTVINDNGHKDTGFLYARYNMYHSIERSRDAIDELL